MQSTDKPPRVLFIALHLLTRSLSSGGDVLFANVALQLRHLKPDWHIEAIAPEYCKEELQQYFHSVHTVRGPEKEAERLAASPWVIPLVWWRRAVEASRLLARIQPEIVYTTGDFLPNVLVAKDARKLAQSRWVGVIHHINPPPLRRQNKLLAACLSFAMQRASFRVIRNLTDAVFLLNDDTRQALVRMGFSQERLHIAGAGIDLARFPFAPSPAPARRMLWVHRLEPTKGIFDIPKIMADLPADVTLDIVGGGPVIWRDALKRQLEERRLADRVTLHGYVSKETLHQLYATANIFISCSYEEGWGISLCEALAVGIPCIAYRLPSHVEIFGDVIETVPLGNTSLYAQRINALLDCAGDLAQRMRRRSFAEMHDFSRVAKREVRVIDSLRVRPPSQHWHVDRR